MEMLRVNAMGAGWETFWHLGENFPTSWDFSHQGDCRVQLCCWNRGLRGSPLCWQAEEGQGQQLDPLTFFYIFCTLGKRLFHTESYSCKNLRNSKPLSHMYYRQQSWWGATGAPTARRAILRQPGSSWRFFVFLCWFLFKVYLLASAAGFWFSFQSWRFLNFLFKAHLLGTSILIFHSIGSQESIPANGQFPFNIASDQVSICPWSYIRDINTKLIEITF